MIIKKKFVRLIKNLFFVQFAIIILFQKTGYGSFELTGSGARIQAMGQAYVGLANTPDAIFINCSGLAQISQPVFSLFYTNLYGIKEITYGSFAALIPTAFGTFATGITSFGNEIYREQSLILSYNRSVRQKFYWGLNIHYMKLQISDYGSDFSTGISAGFLMRITPKFNWGFSGTNINRPKLGNNRDNLPQTYSTGFTIIPLEQLIVNVDIFKDSDFPVELRTGIEYILFQRIALRTGFSTAPSQFCAGIGFLFKYFEFDYAVTTHADLGLTHHFSMQCQFHQPKNRSMSESNNFETKPALISKIDINTATVSELQKIPGIGSILAQRIVSYRRDVGNFKTLEELRNVKGINKNKLERIKPYIDLVE